MRRTLLLPAILSMLLFAAVSPAGADTVYEPTEDQFFLSNTGTACGANAVYQLTTTPRSGGPNCGYIGGLPFGEIFTTSGAASSTNTYTASEGVPLRLDGSRDGSGQITILHAQGTTGVGQIVIDITLRGKAAGSNTTKTIASTQVNEITAGDMGRSTFTFDLDIPDTDVDYTTLSMDVNVRGIHANTGYTSSQGDSNFTLPTLTAVAS